ncbi:hypothetical protein Lal_00031969 [Lupinus albus]|nr:hypothetical protein Lal_00031969 [Lupinus albus]
MSNANEIEEVNTLTLEFIKSLSTSGLPNHKIKSKVGTLIMLLRNLDQPEGLCNDTRMVVTKMTNHVLEAKFMSCKNVGHHIYSSYINVFIPIFMTSVQSWSIICSYFKSLKEEEIEDFNS